MKTEINIFQASLRSEQLLTLLQVLFEKYDGECEKELTVLLGIAFSLSSDVFSFLNQQVAIEEAIDE